MNKFAFLPEDYTAPKSSSFWMKIQDGENKIRILSQPILGWEDWHDKKPVRYRMNDKPAKPFDPKKPIRHFWSFIVWNHNEEKIQILQITQATIRNCIEALCKDSDWGAPYAYDIKIFKKGDGVDTEYGVNPLPHKPISDHVKEAFTERRCNLEAIFDNGDPFSPEWSTYTPGVFDGSDVIEESQPQPKPSVPVITADQARGLSELLMGCDPTYKTKVLETLKKTFSVDSLSKIPVTIYDSVKSGITKNYDEYQAKLKDKAFNEEQDILWAV